MNSIRTITAAGAALCLCLFIGCVGARTQLDYVRDLFPETVATRVLDLEDGKDFSEELARGYLTQNINATRYGIALSSTGGRGKRSFDFADLHITLFEQLRTSLTRKEVVYILELKSFCGHRAAMVGSGNAFVNTYSYSREPDARSTAAALLTLGARACDPMHALPGMDEPPPQE